MKYFNWQKPIWERLLARRERLPHALLLRGRQGTGKLGFAEALAQALLCEGPAGRQPCGSCPSCAWFEQRTHPDFRRLEPESATEKAEAEEGAERKGGGRPRQQITVDQVREVSDFVNVSSHRGGYKVVLLHPAESLNLNAANALLKTLEEPPPRTLLLLVSHRPRRVLPTIVSRCEQVAMPVPDAAQAERWLREQGVREPGLVLAEAGYAPVAALALADPERQGLRVQFLESLAAPAGLDAVMTAERMQAAEPALLVGWLQRWCYDLMRLQCGTALRFNPDFARALEKLAGRADPRGLLALARLLSEAQRIAQHPLNARLFAESLLLYYSRSMMPETPSSRG
jgi:DNA polymerase-3 subunit delta'